MLRYSFLQKRLTYSARAFFHLSTLIFVTNRVAYRRRCWPSLHWRSCSMLKVQKIHDWTGEQEHNPITHWQSPFCCVLTILSVRCSQPHPESSGLDAARPNRVAGLSRSPSSLSLSAGINLISSSLQTNPPLRGLNMKWRLLICSQKSARLHFISLSSHIDSIRRSPDWVRAACSWRLLSWITLDYWNRR